MTKENISSYSFHVGDLACTVFLDTHSMLSEADFAGIFPTETERLVPAFRALGEPQPFCINVLLVETAGKRVLIDTGIGQADPDDLGQLPALLKGANVPLESIQTVIITHFHMDHLCGLIDADGRAIFASARVVVPEVEYAHWMSEETLAKIDPWRAGMLRRVFDAYAGQVKRFAGTDEIEPGIRYRPAPGHTPGHQAVELAFGDARLLHLVDTAHMPLQVGTPDAVCKYDIDSDTAIATRKALLDEVAEGNRLVLTYHFPFPGLGHIQETETGRAWVAI